MLEEYVTEDQHYVRLIHQVHYQRKVAAGSPPKDHKGHRG